MRDFSRDHRGMSINTITLDRQGDLPAILEACLRHQVRAVCPWRHQVQQVGVDIVRTKFIAYVLAAFGTGLAGALYFLDSARISPDAAFSVLDWTAYVIFIVVIGGIGTIEGPILGAIIFVVLQSTLSGYGPWYLILLGALGIAVMLVAPKGIWGTFSAATGIHLFPTRRRLRPVADGPPSKEA